MFIILFPKSTNCKPSWIFLTNISNYQPSRISLKKYRKLPAKLNYPPISSQAPLGLPFSAAHSAQIVSTPDLPRARRFVSQSRHSLINETVLLFTICCSGSRNLSPVFSSVQVSRWSRRAQIHQTQLHFATSFKVKF